MHARQLHKSLCPIAVLIALSGTSGTQVAEPFASLSLGIDSDCPFTCDSFVWVFAGEYTSSNWQTPFVQRVEPSSSGTTLIVYMNIDYDSGAGLPVLAPLEKRIPCGPLPMG